MTRPFNYFHLSRYLTSPSVKKRFVWAGSALAAILMVQGAAWASDVPLIGRPWTVPPVPGGEPVMPLVASSLPADRAWSLAALSDLALRNNPATRLAWSAALANQAGVAAASALLQPNVTLPVPLMALANTPAASLRVRTIAPLFVTAPRPKEPTASPLPICTAPP